MSLLQFYIELMNEALPISIAKKYSKGWDKSRYTAIFQKTANLYPSLNQDPKLYRVYIPFNTTKDIPIPHQIQSYIQNKGYEIDDYAKGILSKKGDKRKFKIGRIIDDPIIKNMFDNDPNRATSTKSDLLICISRHPYDIAGMSTDRGWTSCMELKSGENSHYVISDVKEGSIIAYLIHNDDMNITKPIARMLIKPYINTDDPNDIILGNDDRVYGTSNDDFKHIVEKWLKWIEGDRYGIFKMNDKLYSDSESDEKIRGDKNG